MREEVKYSKSVSNLIIVVLLHNAEVDDGGDNAEDSLGDALAHQLLVAHHVVQPLHNPPRISIWHTENRKSNKEHVSIKQCGQY